MTWWWKRRGFRSDPLAEMSWWKKRPGGASDTVVEMTRWWRENVKFITQRTIQFCFGKNTVKMRKEKLIDTRCNQTMSKIFIGGKEFCIAKSQLITFK
uniref:Uncharacterized protein n=1 Tax=Romanomermis culicivorax TaxID=13658 RepID=A0A915KND3_ROMCU